MLVALTLTTSLPALTQEGETQGEYQYDPGVGEDQYDLGAGEIQYEEQGVAEAGCDWYWGYRWSAAGEWENWCWDPQKGGWWYATNEDGTKQYYHYS